MAGRTGTSLQKRQKEMARAEKQREKFAKRIERKKEPLAEQTDEVLLEPPLEEAASVERPA